jgi:2,3,4,5-tetrahydropyridine-2-carboxylate N-succinyltransferase
VGATRPRQFAGGTFGLPCVLVVRWLEEGQRHSTAQLEEMLREHGVSV